MWLKLLGRHFLQGQGAKALLAFMLVFVLVVGGIGALVSHFL